MNTKIRIILYASGVRNASVYTQTLVKIFMFPYKNSLRRSVLILTCKLYFTRSTPKARNQVDCFRHFLCTGCGTDALYICLTHKTSLWHTTSSLSINQKESLKWLDPTSHLRYTYISASSQHFFHFSVLFRVYSIVRNYLFLPWIVQQNFFLFLFTRKGIQTNSSNVDDPFNTDFSNQVRWTHSLFLSLINPS